MDLYWVSALLFLDLFLGILIGRMSTRISWRMRPWHKGQTLTSSEAQKGDQCEQLLSDVQEQLVSHSSALDTFLALTGTNADNVTPASKSEQLESLKLSNECTGKTLDDALEKWARLVHRFRDVLTKEVQRLQHYRGKTVELSQIIESFEGSATLDGLIDELSAATLELRHENEHLREHLSQCQQQLQTQMARCDAAEELARIDSLTRLPNRRAFEEKIAELHALYQRDRREYALVLFDLDRFKILNDSHGHAAGDAVLTMVGQVLRDCCRLSDHVSRYGGEEFALLIPDCSKSGTRTLAERCRARIQTATLGFADHDLSVTTSAGVAQVIPSQTTQELIARADAALYAAKEAGRNTVSFDGQVAPLQEVAANE